VGISKKILVESPRLWYNYVKCAKKVSVIQNIHENMKRFNGNYELEQKIGEAIKFSLKFFPAYGDLDAGLDIDFDNFLHEMKNVRGRAYLELDRRDGANYMSSVLTILDDTCPSYNWRAKYSVRIREEYDGSGEFRVSIVSGGDIRAIKYLDEKSPEYSAALRYVAEKIFTDAAKLIGYIDFSGRKFRRFGKIFDEDSTFLIHGTTERVAPVIVSEGLTIVDSHIFDTAFLLNNAKQAWTYLFGEHCRAGETRANVLIGVPNELAKLPNFDFNMLLERTVDPERPWRNDKKLPPCFIRGVCYANGDFIENPEYIDKLPNRAELIGKMREDIAARRKVSRQGR
jgi:hypothetical protein